MKVIAVVVTYNGAQWVDRCFGSLRSSEHQVTTIVVDNGSTDGTQAAIRQRFPEVELIQSEENLGFGQANNRGMRLAKERGADHVFLLNQDAWVVSDAIGTLIDMAGTHPEFGVLSPLHLNGAGDALDHNFSRAVGPDRCPDLYSDLILHRSAGRVYTAKFVNAAAWLITRNCLSTVGGFDPTFFHYGEDDNYIHRVHFHGLKVGVVPDAVIHHDREKRSESTYFSDVRKRRIRQLRLLYADPAKDLDPGKERMRLKRAFARAVITASRSGSLAAIEDLKIFDEAALASVVRNRASSSERGPTFLQ